MTAIGPTSNQPNAKPRSAIRKPAPKRITAAFSGDLPRSRVGFGYALSLMVVAGAMVLLVTAYLALIGLACYGMYWHATENLWILKHDSGGRLSPRASVMYMILRLTGYIAPFVIGSVLIFFMFKPLFARHSREHEPLTLDRSQEPTLYAVLDELCRRIGAPTPRQIEVDCDLNAAASLTSGILSFRRDLTLVLGLPLAASLPLQQFIGVVAHELGHFSQNFGLRLSYLIRRINIWFARVVYERDQWDDWIATYGEDSEDSFTNIIALMLLLTRPFIWLNRQVLKVLMYIGNAISCVQLRQLEYHADQVAAAVTGTTATITGLKQLPMLAAAQYRCYGDLTAAWREQRLPDNIPALIAARAKEMTPEQKKLMIAGALSQKTGFIDTHPSLAKRIGALQARPNDGIFSYSGPATALFANFKMIANAVTLVYYRRVVGLDVSANNLVKTETLIQQHAVIDKDYSASERYFQNCLSRFLPARIGDEPIEASKNPKEDAAKLKKLRKQFDEVSARYAKHFTTYREHMERLSQLTMADTLLRIGVKRLNKKEWGINRSDRDAIKDHRSETEALINELMPKLKSINQLQAQRLRLGLQLALVPQVTAKLKLKESPEEELERLMPIIRNYEAYVAGIPEISRRYETLAMLLQCIPTDQANLELYPDVLPVVKNISRDISTSIREIIGAFGSYDYPFEHAEGNISIFQFLSSKTPDTGDPVNVVNRSGETLDKLFALYSRCLTRLGHIAERVERVLGMPAPEPKDDAENQEAA